MFKTMDQGLEAVKELMSVIESLKYEAKKTTKSLKTNGVVLERYLTPRKSRAKK